MGEGSRDGRSVYLCFVSFLITIVGFPRSMAVQGVRSLGRIMSGSCYFFLCDMQEKFRPTIKYFPEIISVASRMVSMNERITNLFIYEQQRTTML